MNDNEIPHRSPGLDFIGGLISISEAECSLSSKAANASVKEYISTLEKSRKYATFTLIGDILGEDPFVSKRVLLLGTPNFKLDDNTDGNYFGIIDGNPIQLAFAQSIEKITTTIQKKTLMSPVRRKKSKDVEIEKDVPTGEPILVALMEGNIALTIATFDSRRNTDECNHVQIGSEMRADTLYSTTLDDRTSRFGVIEAIRKIKDGETMSSDQKNLLINLIKTEIDIHKDILSRETRRQLVNYCFRNMKFDTDEQEILVMGKDCEHEKQKIRKYEIVKSIAQENATAPSIVIAKPSDDKDNMYIYAITRGNVAFKIATLNRDSEDIEFESDQVDTASVTNIILSYVHNKNDFNNIQSKLKSIQEDLERDQDLLENSIKDEEELKKRIGIGQNKQYKDDIWRSMNDDWHRREELSDIRIKIKRLINNLNTSIDLNKKTKEECEINFGKFGRFGNILKYEEQIFQLLKGSEIFKDFVGENYSHIYEQFINNLYEKNKKSSEWGGTLLNVNTGKVTIDTVVKFTMEYKDGIYHISIFNKEINATEEEFSEIYSVNIDTLNPKPIDQTRAKELMDLLSTLKPVYKH